ncbi:hypothetical protein A9Q87_13365 [Flavobacteriales bacterium 34_180_T64]|nr:hypothetical protein A9Q87_13365 [Flavobacteriales bacterium 34_180_T64]
MAVISNVIDVPKQADAKDQLGISSYKDGLVNFVKTAQTPITIAIQGEWGSGKTSLMNSVKHELCDDNSAFYGIWINTWEYALLSNEQATMTNIIKGILNEVITVLEANNIKDVDKLKKRATSFLSSVSRVAVKAGANMVTAGVAGNVTDELFGSSTSGSTIKELHTELQKHIKLCVEKVPNKKGFLFFIDDLDRINPPMAVQILELLKNIFDLEDCIFLLAIDYDVVVKGLEPKFGKKTDENEREFRSFFEKIIQLPFTMPVSRYNVRDIIIDNLLSLGYFTQEELTDSFQNSIQEISLLTVGKNPRAIKRLLNALSLIKCINQSVNNESGSNTIDGLVNYSVFSIQIAYPLIYKVLSEFPDFINWGQEVKTAYRLNVLDKAEQQNLINNDLFDEEWEQVLYQLCQKDAYLKVRVARISKLLNKIKQAIFDADEDLETIMTNAFEIASVTSIEADSGQQTEDIHKSSFLKAFRKQFFTAFQEALHSQGYEVINTQKRVQSNLKFEIQKDGKRYNNLFVSIITNKKDYRINFRYDFWYYAKVDVQPFEDALESHEDIYAGLKDTYNSALQRFENLEFPEHVKKWNGISINDGHYTVKFHVNAFTANPWGLVNNQEEMNALIEQIKLFVMSLSEIKNESTVY